MVSLLFWGMWGTPSLLSLSSPLRPKVGGTYLIGRGLKKTPWRNIYIKYMYMNKIPNLFALNNPVRVDIPLKPINQFLTKEKFASDSIDRVKMTMPIIIYIGRVSIYMGPAWLLITLLIIMYYFFVSDLKTTINPRSQCLGQERKNILQHFLLGDKIIENCLKIDATH